MERIDFHKNFDFSSKNNDYYCYINNEKLIITEFKKYDGPITLQYLPNGGIQSLFNFKIIVKVNNGFLEIDKVIYKGNTYTSKEFIILIGEFNLLNHQLI